MHIEYDTSVDSDDSKIANALIGERLERRYIRVRDVALWDKNPKEHDIGTLIELIKRHGFRDAPTFDSSLNALVAGNGRTIALSMMEKQNYPAPRGIAVHSETNEWYMPVNFGVNSPNVEEAVAYAIDHNNSTMAGGTFTPIDMRRMWDSDKYMSLLNDLPSNMLPVTVDSEDLEMLNKFLVDINIDTPPDKSPSEPKDNDEIDMPKEITLFVREHGIYDDVCEAIKVLLEQNSWYNSVDVTFDEE